MTRPVTTTDEPRRLQLEAARREEQIGRIAAYREELAKRPTFKIKKRRGES